MKVFGNKNGAFDFSTFIKLKFFCDGLIFFEISDILCNKDKNESRVFYIPQCNSRIKMFVENCKLIRRPYHIFKIESDCFFFEIQNKKFFQIDSQIYDFLEVAQYYPLEKAYQFLDEQVAKQQISLEKAREIRQLRDIGIFRWERKDFCVEKLLRGLIDKPITSIEALISEQCNLRCKYCYLHNEPIYLHKDGMNEEIARKLLDFLMDNSKDSKLVDIIFFGGEPLCNKPMLKYLICEGKKIADKRNKKILFRMTTNGTLLDKDTIDLISKNKIALMVSLDGDEELHDGQCQTVTGEKTFAIVDRNIKWLNDAGISPELRATMVHPMPDLRNILNTHKKYRSAKIIIGPAEQMFDSNSEYAFTANDYKCFYNQLFDIFRNKENPPNYKSFSDIFTEINANHTEISRTKCFAANRVICVATDGTIYPCSKFAGMEKWSIGNLSQGIDQERRVNFWKKYYNSIIRKCSKCWAWGICHGPCPWEIATHDGKFQTPDKKCDYMMKRIEFGVFLFTQQSNHKSQGEKDTNEPTRK